MRDYMLQAAYEPSNGSVLGPIVVANAVDPRDMQVKRGLRSQLLNDPHRAVWPYLCHFPSSVPSPALFLSRPCTLQVVGLGCLMAEEAGLPDGILYRSAGSLVAARAAIQSKPLLTSSQLQETNVPGRRSGLIVVGSYVGKSTEQLQYLRQECGGWLDEVQA